MEVLFKDAPDLLEEFKAFLPSASGPTAPRVADQNANLNWSVSTGPERTDKRSGKASPGPLTKPTKRRKKPVEEDATSVAASAVPTGAKAGGSRVSKLHVPTMSQIRFAELFCAPSPLPVLSI